MSCQYHGQACRSTCTNVCRVGPSLRHILGSDAQLQGDYSLCALNALQATEMWRLVALLPSISFPKLPFPMRSL